ncbi:MAG: indole-3-glycerol phosphate synthase TrpC, partial [Acidimicrobiia bacterium]
LATFRVDRKAQLALVTQFSRGLTPSRKCVVVAESGIESRAQAAAAELAGADAVLVGTAILQAPDPGEAIRALVGVGWP